MKKFLVLLLAISLSPVFSQMAPMPENWHLLDHETSGYWGISVNKFYNELREEKPKEKVIVAILDNGVDVLHEDLKDNIWINEDEIPENGVDDDNNGYIDDVYGWNFLGGKDGDIQHETLEITRMYRNLKKQFEGREESSITKTEKRDYKRYKELESTYKGMLEEVNKDYEEFAQVAMLFQISRQYLQERIGKANPNYEEVSSLEATEEDARALRDFYLYALQHDLEKSLEEGQEYFDSRINYNLNLDYNPRNKVGDNLLDSRESDYGNNFVAGPMPDHGTHVAGIVGAVRGNSKGVDGVASFVSIMPVRVVPNGDERDKDVANGIRYAVDNGAKIINMSFGKPLSPNREIVEEAIDYGLSKGVLFIHGAGNEAANIDKSPTFPNRDLQSRKKTANAWIEVGASGSKDGEFTVAAFSNYGPKSLDIFAPGVSIMSTMPGNQYANNDGTSMSSPVVAGVAALIWSYYPEFTAGEVKDIIIDSGVPLKNEMVEIPGSEEEEIKLKKLSKNAKLLNAYQAMKLAKERAGK